MYVYAVGPSRSLFLPAEAFYQLRSGRPLNIFYPDRPQTANACSFFVSFLTQLMTSPHCGLCCSCVKRSKPPLPSTPPVGSFSRPCFLRPFARPSFSFLFASLFFSFLSFPFFSPSPFLVRLFLRLYTFFPFSFFSSFYTIWFSGGSARHRLRRGRTLSSGLQVNRGRNFFFFLFPTRVACGLR